MKKLDDKLDFTFLTHEQVFGENQLDILKIYGNRCAITDFGILLGGYVVNNAHTSEGGTLKNRAGIWWTKSSYQDTGACAVYHYGNDIREFVTLRFVGARPALSYSSISSFSSNAVRGMDKLLVVEYGECPHWITDKKNAEILEKLFQKETLKGIRKQFPTDFVKVSQCDFLMRDLIEYEYDGQKYIRFVADSNCVGEILSDETKVKKGKPYWIRVEPIKWLVSEKFDIALSKYILFAGVPFHHKSNYRGDFENTFIKQFMDHVFAKAIIPSKSSQIENSDQQSSFSILDEFVNVSGSNREAIIMSLVLGKIPNGNCYTASMIAQILDMPLKEVRDIIKRNLHIYQKQIKQDYRNLNRAIDTIITEATKKPSIIEKILKR